MLKYLVQCQEVVKTCRLEITRNKAAKLKLTWLSYHMALICVPSHVYEHTVTGRKGTKKSVRMIKGTQQLS